MNKTPSSTTRGFLDSVTDTGYFEGWAFEEDRPLHAVRVGIQSEGRLIAQGIAHRFRRDLMESGCGTGWCAFRIRGTGQVTSNECSSYTLIDIQTGSTIHENPYVASIVDAPRAKESIEDFCANDPTQINAVWQLRGCERHFGEFIQQNGIDRFLRTAYIYVLGRPADAHGLENYGRMLRLAVITPLGILDSLASSDEYRSRRRELAAPNAIEFPFR